MFVDHPYLNANDRHTHHSSDCDHPPISCRSIYYSGRPSTSTWFEWLSTRWWSSATSLCRSAVHFCEWSSRRSLVNRFTIYTYLSTYIHFHCGRFVGDRRMAKRGLSGYVWHFLYSKSTTNERHYWPIHKNVRFTGHRHTLSMLTMFFRQARVDVWSQMCGQSSKSTVVVTCALPKTTSGQEISVSWPISDLQSQLHKINLF